jgi:hypothetical protein
MKRVYDYDFKAKSLQLKSLPQLKKTHSKCATKPEWCFFYETIEDQKMFCMVRLLISISVYKHEICVM